MYGEFLGGHILLVYSWIEALFLAIPAFEGLHNDIYFVVTRYIQRKLFKENEGSDEREQTIVDDRGHGFSCVL